MLWFFFLRSPGLFLEELDGVQVAASKGLASGQPWLGLLQGWAMP